MPHRTSIFMRSVAVMVAATIGAGIFGVPYVMAKAGILIGLFWLVIVAGALLLENLLLGEIALRLPDDLRFVGFARKILKPYPARFTELLLILSLLGAMLAYLLLGVQFLTNLISPFIAVNATIMLVVYFCISTFIISHKFKEIEQLNVVSVSLFVTLVVLLISIAIPKIHPAFITVTDPKNFFLPYGVILFALASAGIIPTLEASLKGHKQDLRKIIILGGIIPACFTGLMGVVIALVSTYSTTPDSLLGLSKYGGNFVLYLGSLIGLVAIIGVHGLTGNTVKEILIQDYRLNPKVAIGTAVLIPFLIVASGAVSFIKVLSLVGGVIGGLLGIMIGVMSLRSHHMKTRAPEYCLKSDRLWAWVVIVFFAAGALYELYYTFLK